jgi:hypothetical protein
MRWWHVDGSPSHSSLKTFLGNFQGLRATARCAPKNVKALPVLACIVVWLVFSPNAYAAIQYYVDASTRSAD